MEAAHVIDFVHCESWVRASFRIWLDDNMRVIKSEEPEKIQVGTVLKLNEDS